MSFLRISNLNIVENACIKHLQLSKFRLADVPGMNMFLSKVMRVLILQKKLLERQDGGVFEWFRMFGNLTTGLSLMQASGNDFARLMGCQLGLSEKRLPHSIFHFPCSSCSSCPSFLIKIAIFGRKSSCLDRSWQVHLCWLSSPGLEESYHSEQQKLLERIRSLERAAAPGTRKK